MTALHIRLACNSDAAYAPYAAAMLHSALVQTPQARFTVYYLQDPDFPEPARARIHQALARFGSRVELHFITVPDALVTGLPLFKLMVRGAVRPVMWYRVFLPQLLPNVPKVLYLDCDTVVMDSLEPLWMTDLADRPIAAVSNPFVAEKAGKPWTEVCDLPCSEAYFNSGVMLMNLEYFRAHDISRRVVAHGLANADWVRFGDQDSLVSVLHAERLPLHPRWNLMRCIIMTGDARRLFGHAAVEQAIRHPGIVHFEGTTKPWVDPTQHPYGRAYLRHAKRLPWPVPRTSFRLLDIENFLTRHNWIGLRRLFRRLSRRMQALLT